MNKNIQKIYDQALAVVLDEFGMTAEYMFTHNTTECVQARMSLLEALVEVGLTNQEIAACTHLKSNSICKMRNKYDDKRAPWTVKMCIEHIKKISDKSLLFSN